MAHRQRASPGWVQGLRAPAPPGNTQALRPAGASWRTSLRRSHFARRQHPWPASAPTRVHAPAPAISLRWRRFPAGGGLQPRPPAPKRRACEPRSLDTDMMKLWSRLTTNLFQGGSVGMGFTVEWQMLNSTGHNSPRSHPTAHWAIACQPLGTGATGSPRSPCSAPTGAQPGGRLATQASAGWPIGLRHRGTHAPARGARACESLL